MTKDRLPALRASQYHEENGLEDVATVDMDGGSAFMPEFFNEVEEIWENIEKIEHNVKAVSKIHSDILSSTKSETKDKEYLDRLMSEVKKLANKVRGKLMVIQQDIAKMEEELERSDKGSKANLRIHKTQHSTLSHRFVKVMTDYSSIQSDYRERCKSRIQRQLEITGKQTTNEEIEQMIESGNPHVFTGGLIIHTEQEKQRLADIEARHSDIIKLEKSISELHDMYIGMALIIENQGEMIDRIEYSVAEATEYTGRAIVATKKAAIHQSKARRKKILILICLTVLIVVLAAVFGGIFG